MRSLTRSMGAAEVLATAAETPPMRKSTTKGCAKYPVSNLCACLWVSIGNDTRRRGCDEWRMTICHPASTAGWVFATHHGTVAQCISLPTDSGPIPPGHDALIDGKRKTKRTNTKEPRGGQGRRW